MKSGVELIAEERQRQIEKEGYTAAHDAEHQDSELAFLACYYALPCMFREEGVTITPYRLFEETGFDRQFGRRDGKSRIRRLQIAGALIAAEIDRLLHEGEEE